MTTQSKPGNKAESTAKKKTAKNTGKKRMTNLLKLCSEMGKYVEDANDKEIIKRFKTTIFSSVEDITKVNLDKIIKEPKSIEVSTFTESIQPYVKHYLFMKYKITKNYKFAKSNIHQLLLSEHFFEKTKRNNYIRQYLLGWRFKK